MRHRRSHGLPGATLGAAGKDLSQLLDPAQGGLDPPIRADIFGSVRFRQHGASLAGTHAARPHARGASTFTPRLKDNIAVLERARQVIARLERSGQHVSPAGEWLLDNDHLVAAQIKEIHDALPRRFFRDLPVLVDAHLAGLPRIYGVAWAFVAHTDSAFDEELLSAFLDAYQDVRGLTLGELWALPTTLRVVLIENLRRLAEGVAAAKAARELANQWCDQQAASSGPGGAALASLVEAMARRGVGDEFAWQVQQRLQASAGTPLPEAQRLALQAALAQAWDPSGEAQARQQAREAADNLSVGNVITSLRRLGDADWRSLIGQSSRLVRAMQASPVFCAEREDTQDDSLHRIERLARRSGRSEPEVATCLLELMQAETRNGPPDAPACAPGHWLQGEGRPALQRALGLGPVGIAWARLKHLLRPAYMAGVVLGSLALAGGFAQQQIDPASGPGWWWALALLSLWPASEAVIALLHRLVSESLPPWRLPRLALVDGIPQPHRVLVVMPVMLTTPAGIQALADGLARHHLANPEAHAQFALLSDFADAKTARTDADAPLLAAAVAAIDALEARHGRPGEPRRFLLLHRDRTWSDSEQAFIGWERKRGKLEQLLALLAASPEHPGGSAAGAVFVDLGPRSQPSPGTPHVLTLDSDTVLPPGALRALVGLAAHPLNQPRLDAAGRRVLSGHGILQPRISGPLPAPGEVTPFHWLFAGQGGIDPYTAASSELYQDLFDEASFSGKGLLQVQALHRVLGGRLPVGQVLSHDLVEGAVARCGGVSDITLIEAAPMHPDLAAARIHRWTRGDWQLWPLLWHARRHGLGALGCWKLLDNIRRSLVAPFSVLLLLIALATPHVSAVAVLALLALAFGGGPLLGAVAGLAPGRDGLAAAHFYRGALTEVLRALAGTAWSLAMLLRQAGLLVDAIAKATWRSAVSRRHLLQWTTAAAAEAAVRHGLPALVRRHRAVSGVAGALLLGIGLLGTPVSALAWGVLGAWAATPLWIALASRAWGRAAPAPLPAEDLAYLQGVARDTWRLFERHVGPASHHLPPDNVQTLPDTMVAQRTSPTNIGLYLLSLACARAFGWIDTATLLARAEATLATLDRLVHHRGHLLNWYDTQSLAPLPPAYVSTVDSGNLCGHLLALAVACDELAAAAPGRPGQATDAAPDDLGDQAARLRALARRCRARAEASEFGFLYDPRRRLLHLGLRVAEGTLDSGYYDLLASEARLASLWAIAKGDLPPQHWGALGRPFFGEGRQAGLRSWSGSMFEYLMPALVLQEPADSVLGSASRAAIALQQAFGRSEGLPWGISESAYAASDHSLAYQYAPQGVPRLALRRTPPDERVIAPYATLLAVAHAPVAAVANLHRLEALGARGEMGFFEALDYTADRQSAGSRYTPVCTFMAHHQGMAIVALANLLLGGVAQRWGMGDPRLAAVAPLLQERVPRELPPLPAITRSPPMERRRRSGGHGSWLRSHFEGQAAGVPLVERRASGLATAREVLPGESALQPTVLLSNGRYSVALRANGAGWSRCAVGPAVVDLSRWRDDALRDEFGSFIYLRRAPARPGDPPRPVVSLTQHPAPDPAAHYRASLQRDRVCHEARWSDLRSRVTTWVSPEDDIELRQVELWNDGERPLRLELLSAFEVALSEARADETHPAFANLFIEADWDAADHALYLARKPRRAGEPSLQAVHFIAHADAPLGRVQAQADRARWLGRHRDSAHPLADFGPTETPGGARPTGLDPVAALSVSLELAPGGSLQLTLATAAATSRPALETLVDRYRQPTTIARASLMSATFAGIRQRDLQLPAEDRAAIQVLSSLLVQLHARPMPAPAAPGGTACDRRSLWRHGVSGDRPIVLASIGAVHGLRLVHALVQGLAQWSWAGLGCDLVLLSSEARSYLMPLQRALQGLREQFDRDAARQPSGFAHGALVLLHRDELPALEQASLESLARVHLHADGRPLWHHVQTLADWHDRQRDSRREQACSALPAPVAAAVSTVPAGAFDPVDGAFGFMQGPALRPQRPWVNVLANPAFGTLLSDAGSACSWAGNSRLHQLTPWTNDPLRDTGGEHLCLQDLDTHACWRIGAGAGAAPQQQHWQHAPGHSHWRQDRGALRVELGWCVDPVQAVKQVRLVFTHRGTGTVRLRLVAVFEWLMGTQRSDRQTVHTRRERLAAGAGTGPAITDLLLATQCDDHAGSGGQTAFVALQAMGTALLDDWSCDRRELFDARGALCLPDHLAQAEGAGLDPCAAVGRRFALAPGQPLELVLLLGHADDADQAIALARAALAVAPAAREAAVAAHWQGLLGGVQLSTPDPLFDALVNHWLPYQVIACRLWGRAGFYQAGGAYGFRDQLQDAMSLAHSAPALLRAQLLRAGARQFPEGDVQHWWHAPGGAGVRTRFSDDLLWLPHAVAHYLRATGDAGVLAERLHFLDAPPLADGAEDAYTTPGILPEAASLYEHGARAIDHSLRVGAHGLPLMGGGDWNDGMNEVGPAGRGESVWLGWFLCRVVAEYAPIARAQGEPERAGRWEAAAHGWRAALHGAAWDGEWFVRAFFDDGSPLGASANSECRIDLIAQAWSVLSGVGDPVMQRQAMASATRLLVDDAQGLIRLLDPPLVHAEPSAGYIQAYPAGVRENGGQYNHAGVWFLMAQAALGDADGAWQSFTRLSPAHRHAHPLQGAAYGLEPYVMAADVYTQAPYAGRGGWSWYTGAAGWLHRAAIESICGLQLEADRLRWLPRLPSHWPAVELRLRLEGSDHCFLICRPDAQAEIEAAVARGAVRQAPGEWLQRDALAAASVHLVVTTVHQAAGGPPAGQR